MIFEMTDYRDILQKELYKRCEVNPQYSLRAFANKLNISPSTLSEVLNRKTGLSIAKAKAISERINFSKLEADYFLSLVQSTDSRSKRDRELAKIKLLRFNKGTDKKLDLDTWKFMSEWYHAAILELTKVKGFKSDYSWMAGKLGIKTIEVRQACDRLIRLGLLHKIEGKLKTTGRWLLNSPEEIPSESIKKFHLNVMKSAAAAIYDQPLKERNYSSVVMAIDPAQIEEAKKMIADFNRKINRFLTSSEERDSVYCFATQLFKLSGGE